MKPMKESLTNRLEWSAVHGRGTGHGGTIVNSPVSKTANETRRILAVGSLEAVKTILARRPGDWTDSFQSAPALPGSRAPPRTTSSPASRVATVCMRNLTLKQTRRTRTPGVCVTKLEARGGIEQSLKISAAPRPPLEPGGRGSNRARETSASLQRGTARAASDKHCGCVRERY
jgi:hypothetical protein